MSQQELLLKVEHMHKSFGITKALKDVSIEIRKGQILGLIGENGSGKSTIALIIAAIQGADSGEMYLEGKPYKPEHSADANNKGICMILQEKGTFDMLTVAKNIFIGKEENFSKYGVLNNKAMNAEAQKALAAIHAQHIQAEIPLGRLNFEDRKLVEVARAMYGNPKILIVDETTTALSRNGRDILYNIMKDLKKEGKSTTMELTLKPGEATIIALNQSEKDKVHAVTSDALKVVQKDGKLSILVSESGRYITHLNDASTIVKDITVPDNIDLDEWTLEVEDWNEGEKVTIHEDRGLGYVTNEVYYETKKTKIQVGKTALKPWKDIPVVGPQVSGVGYYTTSFQLPETWAGNNGAYLQMGSTNGNTVAVYVNGKKAPAVDICNLSVEITELLVKAENTITVEVSSTLNNRLIARGYYEGLIDTIAGLTGSADGLKIEVQDYGMTGMVSLVTYTVERIK